MFEGFDHQARDVVLRGAPEEARVLRHGAVDVDHLLLALARDRLPFPELDHQRLQARVIALRGVGEAGSPEWLPFTPEAQALLEAQREQTRPVDLLLAILEAESARGLPEDVVETLRERARALAREPMAPRGVVERLRGGWAVPVHLGEELPIGDLGNPRTDGRLLLAILGADRRGGELLRRHGVDEAAVRAALPVEEDPMP